MSQTAPFGKWDSPITADTITEGSIAFAEIFVDPTDSTVYHIEGRPEDEGRYVIVETLSGKDVIPSPYSARSGVHEYGGAAAIAHGGLIYFSNFSDNRLYSVSATSGTPQPVTPDNPHYRYANFAVHPARNDLLVSVVEDHTVDTPQTVINSLYVVNTSRKAVFPFIIGSDSYSSPVFNPSGTMVAWQEWGHLDMPWEGSLIYVAEVIVQADTLVVLNKTYVAGEGITKSVSLPIWSSDTNLVFTSDELNGYHNPYIYSTVSRSARLAIPKSIEEDFGEPAWVFGNYSYAVLDDPIGGNEKYGAFTAFRGGRSVLYIASLSEEQSIVEIRDFPFSIAQYVRSTGGTSIVFIAKKNDAPGGLFSCEFTGASFKPIYRVLKSSSPKPITGFEEYISLPQPMTLQRDGQPLHVVYYAPQNPKYLGSSISNEKPPCIVNIHGGPTSMESQALNWLKIFYTSRGYVWLDVNYGGSSGYGREYISRLAGKWGIVDVQDSQDAPKILSEAPYSLIDGSRIAIRGSSAGGYTTLAALSIAPNTSVFKAGTSSYGVSDLGLLAQFTHKFELRYMNKLLGGPLEKVPDVYAARSPVNYADRITTPLLVLQGALDKVVPLEQANKIVNTIKGQGGADRVEYHLFEGEGHGWRLASTMKAALQYEHEWYEKKLL